MTLADLKSSQQGRIIKVNGDGPIVKRLVEMGFGKGSMVKLERVAPFGDPFDIKIKGYRLYLRKKEAKNIEILIV